MNYPTRELKSPFGMVRARFHPDNINLSVGRGYEENERDRRAIINGVEYTIDITLKLSRYWNTHIETKEWRMDGYSVRRGHNMTSEATTKATSIIVGFYHSVIADLNKGLYRAELTTAKQADIVNKQADLRNKIEQMTSEISKLESEMKELAYA